MAIQVEQPVGRIDQRPEEGHIAARLAETPGDLCLRQTGPHLPLHEESELQRLQVLALLVLDDLVKRISCLIHEGRYLRHPGEPGRPQAPGAVVEDPAPFLRWVWSDGDRRTDAAGSDRLGQEAQRLGVELGPRLLRVFLDSLELEHQGAARGHGRSTGRLERVQIKPHDSPHARTPPARSSEGWARSRARHRVPRSSSSPRSAALPPAPRRWLSASG